MADNKTVDNGGLTDIPVATDEVTYSGDTADVQLVRMVQVSGSEGSKTVVDLPGDATNGLDVDVTRVKPDGTNTLPAMDVAARAGFQKITDGTNTASVTAAGNLNVEADWPADLTGSGSITGNGQTVAVAVTKGRSGFAWQITGTWTGTIEFEVSVDGGTTWVSRRVHNGTDSVTSTAANGVFTASVAAFSNIRVRSSAWSSGTANISHARGVGTQVTNHTAPLPSGTNYLGKVRLTDGTNDASVSTAGSLFVGGGVAHGATDSGNPLKIGAKSHGVGSSPTAVTAGQRTDLYASRQGILYVIAGHPNMQCKQVNYSSAQTNAAIITVSSGTRIVVTSIQVTADTAMSTTPAVRIGFGTSTTPSNGSNGIVASHPGLAGGGGFGRGDGGGILGIGADDEDLRITTGTITGGSIDVCVSWYEVPA